MADKKRMKPEDVARIQRAESKKEGDTKKKLSPRAQRAVDKRKQGS